MSELNQKANETTEAAQKMQELWGKFNQFLNDNSEDIKSTAEANLKALKQDLEKFQSSCQHQRKEREQFLKKITPEDIKKDAEKFWKEFSKKVEKEGSQLKKDLKKEEKKFKKAEDKIDYKLKEANVHFNKAVNSLQDAFESAMDAVQKKATL